MINWNAVTVGETEIVHHSIPGRKLIAGTLNGWVWVYDFAGGYDSYHKNALDEWTIDDPWEEITGSVTFAPYEIGFYVIHYNGRPIDNKDPNFKIDISRVWKRNEGRDE